MVTYWCTWCGATEERENADETVPCWRCVREFAGIFRFFPRALMLPLEADESPGIPAGARKQFEFREQGTGRFVARTKRIRKTQSWRATGTDGR